MAHFLETSGVRWTRGARRALWLGPARLCVQLACGRCLLRTPPYTLCRFSYCALLTCSILGRLQAIDMPRAVQYLVACRNFDGGFGCTPGEAGASNAC